MHLYDCNCAYQSGFVVLVVALKQCIELKLRRVDVTHEKINLTHSRDDLWTGQYVQVVCCNSACCVVRLDRDRNTHRNMQANERICAHMKTSMGT